MATRTVSKTGKRPLIEPDRSDKLRPVEMSPGKFNQESISALANRRAPIKGRI